MPFRHQRCRFIRSLSTSLSRCADLSNLAVSPAARRRGVGRQLVAECEREVLRWRGRELWLEVSLHNTAAMEFYRALGYELVDETSGHEVMKRPLSFEVRKVRRGIMRKTLGEHVARHGGEDPGEEAALSTHHVSTAHTALWGEEGVARDGEPQQELCAS